MYAIATAGALPSPAVQWTYTRPLHCDIAHSNAETAFGNCDLKESGSKSTACNQATIKQTLETKCYKCVSHLRCRKKKKKIKDTDLVF